VATAVRSHLSNRKDSWCTLTFRGFLCPLANRRSRTNY